MSRVAGHVVKNVLLLVLAIFLPPCAVACVMGCGINFVLNLIFTLFLSYLGGMVHATCIVIIYGFRQEEMPRVRRRARIRAKQDGLYAQPAPLAPHYATRPAHTTGAQDGMRADDAYVAGHAGSRTAFARGTVNTTRDNDKDLDKEPRGKMVPGSTTSGESLAVDTRNFGEDRKYS